MSDKRLCYVPGCKKSTSKHISMHKMPDDPATKQKWQDILHMEIVLKSTLICSRHFAVTDFRNNSYNSKIRRLHKNACPSKCLPYPLPESDLVKVELNDTNSNDLGYETIELSNDDIYKMVCNDHTYSKDIIVTEVKRKIKRKPKKKFRFCQNESTINDDDNATENADSTRSIKTNKRLRKLPLKLREPEPINRVRKLPFTKLKEPVKTIRVKDFRKLRSSQNIDDSGSQYIKDFIEKTSTICKYYESIAPWHTTFDDGDGVTSQEIKIETDTVDTGVQCNLEMPTIQINITGTMVDDKFCITSELDEL